MEVVLLGSALSNIAVLLIERYAKRPPRPENVPEAQRGSTAEGTRSAEHAEGKNDHSEGQQSSEMEECPEGSIPALEKKLKELRTEAKRVNSPDTFVQYARLSREANKVEKELVEKKALEPNSRDFAGISELTRLLSNLITPHAKTSVKRSAQLMAVKTVVRALPFLLMWVYFSRYRSSESAGEVMAMDCRAFRPVSFMFRKRTTMCAEDDWVCAAQPPQCVVSYTMVLILANAVFSMMVQAFG